MLKYQRFGAFSISLTLQINEYRIIILNQSITEPLDFYIGDISDITYERDTRSFLKNLRLSFDKLIDD